MEEQGLSDREWRLIWEEALDDAARRRVRRAIRRGETLADPDEATVAVERAVRMRRAVRGGVLANVVMGVLLMALAWVLLGLPSTPTAWGFIGIYGLLVLLSPIAGWVRIRQLERAIRVNRRQLGDP